MNNYYDVIIIGGGPAGLTAGIYALRSGCSVAVVEKNMVGGQINYTYEIDNYPGLPKINGFELAMKFHSHYEDCGGETLYGNIDKVDCENKIVVVDGEEYTCKSIILAMGAKARTLKVEEPYVGRGVAYCAICDGNFYKDKDVVLVGGGNTAVEDAIYLSNIVKSLKIVNNLPDFTAQKVLVEELKNIANTKPIEFLHSTTLTGVFGENKVERVTLSNNGKEVEVACEGLFVAVGRIPDNECIKGQIECDEFGYVKANDKLQTNIEGVYVCGDVRVKNLRQIATAVGDGAIAGTESAMYVNLKK